MARGATFAGVELHTEGFVRYRGEQQDVASCHATVDTAGSVRDRATLTRVLGGAVVAGPVGAIVGGLLRKRVDERQVLLVVAGDRYDWVVEVPARLLGEAHRFAGRLNRTAALAAAEAAAAQVVPGPAPEPYRRRTGVYRAGLT